MARFKITYVLSGVLVAMDGVPAAREIVCTREEKSLQHAMKKVREELFIQRYIDLIDDNEKGHVITVAAIQCVDFDVAE